MSEKKKGFSPFAQELMQSMKEGVAYLKGTGPVSVRVTSLTQPETGKPESPCSRDSSFPFNK
jgi:hypothetical protein